MQSSPNITHFISRTTRTTNHTYAYMHIPLLYSIRPFSNPHHHHHPPLYIQHTLQNLFLFSAQNKTFFSLFFLSLPPSSSLLLQQQHDILLQNCKWLLKLIKITTQSSLCAGTSTTTMYARRKTSSSSSSSHHILFVIIILLSRIKKKFCGKFSTATTYVLYVLCVLCAAGNIALQQYKVSFLVGGEWAAFNHRQWNIKSFMNKEPPHYNTH